MRLRVICLAACLMALGASGPVAADEVKLAPIKAPQNVNGVPVDLFVEPAFTIVTRDGKLHIDLKTVVSLKDLQAKIGSIIDTIALPKDNCARYTLANPVVSIDKKELRAEDAAARLYLEGKVEVWQCIEIPFSNNPAKNKSNEVPVKASVPISAQRVSDTSARLVLGEPVVELGGGYAVVQQGLLKLAGVDLSSEVKKAMDKALGPDDLRVTVPPAYADLKPKINAAKISRRGNESVFLGDFSAVVTPEKLNELIKQALEKKP